MEFDRLYRLVKHQTSEPKQRDLSDIKDDLKRNDSLRGIFRTIGTWPIAYIGSEALLSHRFDSSHPTMLLLFTLTPLFFGMNFYYRNKAKDLLQEHNQMLSQINLLKPREPKTRIR